MNSLSTSKSLKRAKKALIVYNHKVIEIPVLIEKLGVHPKNAGPFHGISDVYTLAGLPPHLIVPSIKQISNHFETILQNDPKDYFHYKTVLKGHLKSLNIDFKEDKIDRTLNLIWFQTVLSDSQVVKNQASTHLFPLMADIQLDSLKDAILNSLVRFGVNSWNNFLDLKNNSKDIQNIHISIEDLFLTELYQQKNKSSLIDVINLIKNEHQFNLDLEYINRHIKLGLIAREQDSLQKLFNFQTIFLKKEKFSGAISRNSLITHEPNENYQLTLDQIINIRATQHEIKKILSTNDYGTDHLEKLLEKHQLKFEFTSIFEYISKSKASTEDLKTLTSLVQTIWLQKQNPTNTPKQSKNKI